MSDVFVRPSSSFALLLFLLTMTSMSNANPISLECEVDLGSSIHKMSWVIDIQEKVAERHFEYDDKPNMYMFSDLIVSPSLIEAQKVSGSNTEIEITEIFTISRTDLSLRWQQNWVSSDPFYNFVDEKSGICVISESFKAEPKF